MSKFLLALPFGETDDDVEKFNQATVADKQETSPLNSSPI